MLAAARILRARVCMCVCVFDDVIVSQFEIARMTTIKLIEDVCSVQVARVFSYAAKSGISMALDQRRRSRRALDVDVTDDNDIRVNVNGVLIGQAQSGMTQGSTVRHLDVIESDITRFLAESMIVNGRREE